MSRQISSKTLAILQSIKNGQCKTLHEIYNSHFQEKNRKAAYNTLYRLVGLGLLEHHNQTLYISHDGAALIHKLNPKKDGVWKLIIFDIPEKQKSVRNFLRARLIALGFKKWQNSIWASPYELDAELEKELSELAKKYFVRLIKTTDINYTKELEEMFK